MGDQRVHPYGAEGTPIQYPSPLEPHQQYAAGTHIPVHPPPPPSLPPMHNKEQEQRLIDSQYPAFNQQAAAFQEAEQGQLHQAAATGVPQPPRPRQRRRNRCLLCCCCISAFVGTCVVLLGILVLVLFLVLHPKLPKYTITQAEITKFTIANATSSSMGVAEGTLTLNAETQFLVRMSNPNKKIGIDYRSISAALFYDGLQIGEGSIPRLYQGHKNTTFVELPMVGHNIVLTPSLGATLQQTLKNDASLTLHARSITHVRVKIGRWTSHTSKVRVKCHVQITNPTRGNVRLLNNGCKFKLLRLRL